MTNCHVLLVRPIRFHITLALLVVASGLLAAPAKVTLFSINVQGEQFEYVTDIDTLMRTPDWTPGKQEPPLAVSDACRIAVEAGKLRFQNADGIAIESVTLRPTATRGDSFTGLATGLAINDIINDIVRWHYEVAILPIVGGKPSFADLGGEIVILMNGSIVEPTRTKAMQ
jgi:hypothetical protein